MHRHFFSSIIDLLFPPHPDVLATRSLIKTELHALISPSFSEPSNILTGLSYAHPSVRALIRANKFHSDQRAAQMLGEVLFELLAYIQEEYAFTHIGTTWILIPMPSSSERRAQRGGNQVEHIIKTLPKKTLHSLSYAPHILQRHHRKSQIQVTRAQRVENIRDAFYVSKKRRANNTLRGASILLIDDVSESGATMHDAMRALQEAGTEKIIGIALAR